MTLLGLGGSELLFAPASEGIGLEATLLPSLAAGVAVFVHLIRDPRRTSRPSREMGLASPRRTLGAVRGRRARD